MRAAKVKTFVEKRESGRFGARVGFILADQVFDLIGKQATDGSAFLGGENLGLTKDLRVEADG